MQAFLTIFWGGDEVWRLGRWRLRFYICHFSAMRVGCHTSIHLGSDLVFDGLVTKKEAVSILRRPRAPGTAVPGFLTYYITGGSPW